MNAIFWIVLVIAIVVIGLGSQILKAYLSNRLVSAVASNNKEYFDNKIDSFFVKLLISPFKREYMRLNMLFFEGNKEKIDAQLEMMLKMRISNDNKLDIAFKAFYFYVDAKEKKKANEALRMVRSLADDQNYQQCKIVYDIELDKSVAYIDDMEAALIQSKGQDRGLYNYYLGLQYSYQGKKKLSNERFKAALRDLKGTAYEIKINTHLK